MSFLGPLSKQTAILMIAFALSSLHAEKKVEVVSNFPVETERLTAALQKQQIDVVLYPSDLRQYPQLLVPKSKWARRWQTLSQALFSPAILGEEVAKVLFFNVTGEYRNRFALHTLPKDKTVLFLWEPPTVLRKMYSQKVYSSFGKIYTWNDDLVDNKTFFKFYYPVLRTMISDIPSFEEKKLCTLISSNRKSRHHKELYSERLKAIQFFESVGEEGFEFYGRGGWDPSIHKNFRGEIEGDKIPVLKHYRFSICYENMQQINGYVTEKIFDCFAAANVPVYWGADNIEEYVPKDCFIDRRHFASLEELHTFLKAMSKEEYEGYITRIQAFLSSDKAQLYSQEHYEKVLAQALSH
jgi:hypothetical protein